MTPTSASSSNMPPDALISGVSSRPVSVKPENEGGGKVGDQGVDDAEIVPTRDKADEVEVKKREYSSEGEENEEVILNARVSRRVGSTGGFVAGEKNERSQTKSVSPGRDRGGASRMAGEKLYHIHPIPKPLPVAQIQSTADSAPSSVNASPLTPSTPPSARNNYQTCVFVANLPPPFSDDEIMNQIRMKFERWGTVRHIKIVRKDGVFCWVHYEDVSSVDLSLLQAPLSPVLGRTIRVERAKAHRTLFLLPKPYFILERDSKVNYGPQIPKWVLRSKNAEELGVNEERSDARPMEIRSMNPIDIFRLFAPFGLIESISKSYGEKAGLFIESGVHVKFAHRDDCVAAVSGVRLHPSFRVVWSHDTSNHNLNYNYRNAPLPVTPSQDGPSQLEIRQPRANFPRRGGFRGSPGWVSPFGRRGRGRGGAGYAPYRIREEGVLLEFERTVGETEDHPPWTPYRNKYDGSEAESGSSRSKDIATQRRTPTASGLSPSPVIGLGIGTEDVWPAIGPRGAISTPSNLHWGLHSTSTQQPHDEPYFANVKLQNVDGDSTISSIMSAATASTSSEFPSKLGAHALVNDGSDHASQRTLTPAAKDDAVTQPKPPTFSEQTAPYYRSSLSFSTPARFQSDIVKSATVPELSPSTSISPESHFGGGNYSTDTPPGTRYFEGVLVAADGIFIGGLDKRSTDEKVLRNIFQKHGFISDLHYVPNAPNTKTGFAFISFDSAASATAAVEEENGTILFGNRIRVQLRKVEKKHEHHYRRASRESRESISQLSQLGGSPEIALALESPSKSPTHPFADLEMKRNPKDSHDSKMQPSAPIFVPAVAAVPTPWVGGFFMGNYQYPPEQPRLYDPKTNQFHAVFQGSQGPHFAPSYLPSPWPYGYPPQSLLRSPAGTLVNYSPYSPTAQHFQHWHSAQPTPPPSISQNVDQQISNRRSFATPPAIPQFPPDHHSHPSQLSSSQQQTSSPQTPMQQVPPDYYQQNATHPNVQNTSVRELQMQFEAMSAGSAVLESQQKYLVQQHHQMVASMQQPPPQPNFAALLPPPPPPPSYPSENSRTDQTLQFGTATLMDLSTPQQSSFNYPALPPMPPPGPPSSLVYHPSQQQQHFQQQSQQSQPPYWAGYAGSSHQPLVDLGGADGDVDGQNAFVSPQAQFSSHNWDPNNQFGSGYNLQ